MTTCLPPWNSARHLPAKQIGRLRTENIRLNKRRPHISQLARPFCAKKRAIKGGIGASRWRRMFWRTSKIEFRIACGHPQRPPKCSFTSAKTRNFPRDSPENESPSEVKSSQPNFSPGEILLGAVARKSRVSIIGAQTFWGLFWMSAGVFLGPQRSAGVRRRPKL